MSEITDPKISGMPHMFLIVLLNRAGNSKTTDHNTIWNQKHNVHKVIPQSIWTKYNHKYIFPKNNFFTDTSFFLISEFVLENGTLIMIPNFILILNLMPLIFSSTKNSIREIYIMYVFFFEVIECVFGKY